MNLGERTAARLKQMVDHTANASQVQDVARAMEEERQEKEWLQLVAGEIERLKCKLESMVMEAGNQGQIEITLLRVSGYNMSHRNRISITHLVDRRQVVELSPIPYRRFIEHLRSIGRVNCTCVMSAMVCMSSSFGSQVKHGTNYHARDICCQLLAFSPDKMPDLGHDGLETKRAMDCVHRSFAS